MSRIKTGCEGVYLRKSARRRLPDGTPDQCYDIVYRMEGKLVWEKVGWISEGCTIEMAAQRRLERLGQAPDPASSRVPTINELWEQYCQRAPHPPRPATYAYIARRFAHVRACDISHADLDRFRQELCETVKPDGTRLSATHVQNIVYLLLRIVTKSVEWQLLPAENAPIARRKNTRPRKTGRTKTPYVGVYVREAKNRIRDGGKPDICWDIHYRAHGREYWEKVGWASEGYTVKDAINLHGQRVKALRHPELITQQQPAVQAGGTIGELWERYEKICLPHVKNTSTIATCYTYIKKRFKNTHAAQISRLDIETFRAELSRTRKKSDDGSFLSKAYINHIISLLGRLINKGVEWGILHPISSPTRRMQFRNADNPRERFLTAKEATCLLDGLAFISPNVCAIAATSLRTGMRIGEILNLKVKDVDLEGKTISIDGKTGKRHAYLPDDFQVFFSYLDKPGDAYVFSLPSGKPIPRKGVLAAFNHVVSAMGLNDGVNASTSSRKVVFHTLRHTFCSWLAIRGVPLYTIGKLAGHSKPDMTQRYAKLSPDAKREAIRHIASFLNSDTGSPEQKESITMTIQCDADIVRWCRGDPAIVTATLRQIMRRCPTPENLVALLQRPVASGSGG